MSQWYEFFYMCLKVIPNWDREVVVEIAVNEISH